MNIHRQLAADYSELAYQVSRNVCHYRAQLIKKPYWGTKARWIYRSFLRREQSKLLAYAEQVGFHLQEAAIKENAVYNCEREGQKFCIVGQALHNVDYER